MPEASDRLISRMPTSRYASMILHTTLTGISLSQGDPKAMEMDPEIAIPASFARSTQAAKRATLSAGVQFKLARLWATEAETLSFTFLQPQAMARSTPFKLAIRARYSTPGF